MPKPAWHEAGWEPCLQPFLWLAAGRASPGRGIFSSIHIVAEQCEAPPAPHPSRTEHVAFQTFPALAATAAEELPWVSLLKSPVCWSAITSQPAPGSPDLNMGRKSPAWALLYFQVPVELVCLIKASNPQPIEGKESIWWCVHLYLWFSDRQHGDNILLVMPWLVTAACSQYVLSIFSLGEPGLAANVSHHFFMVDNIPEATDKMEWFKEQTFETQTWKRSSV